MFGICPEYYIEQYCMGLTFTKPFFVVYLNSNVTGNSVFFFWKHEPFFLTHEIMLLWLNTLLLYLGISELLVSSTMSL